MGLSCLLIWPCFFGPFLDLSYFPPETGPASHRLALLLCTVRRDALVLFPGLQGTLFQSKCSLPSTLTLATASSWILTLNSVLLSGLDGSSFFTRPVPEPRNFGTPCANLLVVLHTSWTRPSRNFRLCTVGHLGL